MIVEIDKSSGFCFGVVYAISMAEKILETDGKLFCLGDIVHNSAEVSRLKEKGLITIKHEYFKTLKNCKVLIRAHGEPPETYEIAINNNIDLIDASCPVVLKLQSNIKRGFDDIVKENGQIVIYGKIGHAEVNGLVGQTEGKGIVIEGVDDIDKIDFSKPVNIFSQTTKSIEGFNLVLSEIRKRMITEQGKDDVYLIANDTICRQVSTRGPKLKEFAKVHDVIVFVSGKKSSNGRILYDVCKQENENTYFVSDKHEINNEWFVNAKSVGSCVAPSTPRGLMDQIAKIIEEV